MISFYGRNVLLVEVDIKKDKEASREVIIIVEGRYRDGKS